ncbi:MAG: ribbon-helix-helix domain-containing protein [Propionibacteriaceae bacterium]|jgi:hypothetical protein|nr:ribbon-helix-helix domain-containing protein [Propionibacteriaceae bacterium]
MKPRMTPAQALAALDSLTDADFETVTPDQAGVTAAEAEDLVMAAHKAMGRPSLTGPGRRSPQLTLRLPASVNDQLTALAARQGRRRSDIVREAIDRYLAA